MRKKKGTLAAHARVFALGLLLLSAQICSAQILQHTSDKVTEKFEELTGWTRAEEDRHPEFPTLEELLRDSTMFQLIHGRADRYDNTFILRSGLIATSDGPTIGLYSFEGKLIYRIPNEHEPNRIFIDSLGNFYCNNRKYLSPDYGKSIPFPYLNVQDTLGRFQYECHYGGVESDSVDEACYDRKEEDFRRRLALPCSDTNDCIANFFGPHRGLLVGDMYGRQQISHFSLPADTLINVDKTVRIYLHKRGVLLRNRTPYQDIHYLSLPNGRHCKTTQDPLVYRYQGKVYLLTQRGLYRML